MYRCAFVWSIHKYKFILVQYNIRCSDSSYSYQHQKFISQGLASHHCTCISAPCLHSCNTVAHFFSPHHHNIFKTHKMNVVEQETKTVALLAHEESHQMPHLQIISISLWWNSILLQRMHYKWNCATLLLPMSIIYWKLQKSSLLLLILWKSKFAYIREMTK